MGLFGPHIVPDDDGIHCSGYRGIALRNATSYNGLRKDDCAMQLLARLERGFPDEGSGTHVCLVHNDEYLNLTLAGAAQLAWTLIALIFAAVTSPFRRRVRRSRRTSQPAASRAVPAALDAQPCPPWCAYPDDHLQDSDLNRYHISASNIVTLTVEAPEIGGGAEPVAPPSEFTAVLLQDDRDLEPRVELDRNDAPAGCLTLGEAEQLAGILTELVRQGRVQASQSAA